MSEFKREDRYVIIKRTDLDHISHDQFFQLRKIIRTIEEARDVRRKDPLEGVVIEKDWPEYEPVWRMLEDRISPPTTIRGMLRTLVYRLWCILGDAS